MIGIKKLLFVFALCLTMGTSFANKDSDSSKDLATTAVHPITDTPSSQEHKKDVKAEGKNEDKKEKDHVKDKKHKEGHEKHKKDHKHKKNHHHHNKSKKTEEALSKCLEDLTKELNSIKEPKKFKKDYDSYIWDYNKTMAEANLKVLKGFKDLEEKMEKGEMQKQKLHFKKYMKDSRKYVGKLKKMSMQ